MNFLIRFPAHSPHQSYIESFTFVHSSEMEEIQRIHKQKCVEHTH